MNGTPVVSNGIVYVTSGDQYLYALLRGDGSQAWKFHANGGFGTRVWPIQSRTDCVFIGADDGNLYAFNASNGSKKWNFNAGEPISHPQSDCSVARLRLRLLSTLLRARGAACSPHP